MCRCQVADAFAGLWLGVPLVYGRIDVLIYLRVLCLSMRLWMNMLVCVHMCVYVYMHPCMNVLLPLLLYMYVCIHPFIYAPEQKIEIENRDHP